MSGPFAATDGRGVVKAKCGVLRERPREAQLKPKEHLQKKMSTLRSSKTVKSPGYDIKLQKAQGVGTKNEEEKYRRKPRMAPGGESHRL